jgi:hypothetical protein
VRTSFTNAWQPNPTARPKTLSPVISGQTLKPRVTRTETMANATIAHFPPVLTNGTIVPRRERGSPLSCPSSPSAWHSKKSLAPRACALRYGASPFTDGIMRAQRRSFRK